MGRCRHCAASPWQALITDPMQACMTLAIFMQCRVQLVRWHSNGHYTSCVLQVLPTSSWQGALQALMACAATMAVWACVFQPLAADAKSLFGNPWSSSLPSSSTPATLEMKVGISLCSTALCRRSKQALASQSLRRELNPPALVRPAAIPADIAMFGACPQCGLHTVLCTLDPAFCMSEIPMLRGRPGSGEPVGSYICVLGLGSPFNACRPPRSAGASCQRRSRPPSPCSS